MCHGEVSGKGTVKGGKGHQVGLNSIKYFSRGDEVAIGCGGNCPIRCASQYPVPDCVNSLSGQLGLSKWHPFGGVSGQESVIQFRGIGFPGTTEPFR